MLWYKHKLYTNMNTLTLVFQRFRTHVSALALILVVCAGATESVQASAPLPQNPQSGSVGLEGTISAPPPSKGAVITNPSSGRSFNALPVNVSGSCPDGTLVKLFSNNIFIGSVDCKGSSFSLEVDLFNGQNDLIARVYDTLDQAGPDSNTVTVNFSDPQLTAVGERVSLTSNFARMGANPGSSLTWPIILTGGSGPYAVSVDWGDGKPQSLKSLTFPGPFSIDHTYDSAGIYRVVVKATDANGVSAYLQLVGVANGTITSGGTASSSKNKTVTVTKTQILIWPSLVAIPLILLTFWIGRRYELLSIRKRIENSTSSDY
jgi:hypothetical protein